MLRLIFQYASILCLYLCISSHALAAQWAIVTSDKAIIYSDIEMQSSIGFIRKGKKIRVGSKTKNKGRVLPLVHNRKIFYVAVKDIETGAVIDQLGTASERIKEKVKKKQIIRNIGLFGGTYYGVVSNENISDENALFIEGGVRGYYTDLKKKENYRLSMSYAKASFTDDITLSYMSLAFANKVLGIQNYGQSFIFYLGGVLIPYAELKYQDLFKLTSQGIGAEFGAELRFNIFKNLNLHLDANYQVVRFLDFELDENGTYDGDYSTYINGGKFLASITFSY